MVGKSALKQLFHKHLDKSRALRVVARTAQRSFRLHITTELDGMKTIEGFEVLWTKIGQN